MSEKVDVVRIAAFNATYLCMEWLPKGRLEASKEWVALNPTRNDRTMGSFRVCVGGSKAGNWADFATGDKGKNMVTLYCYINRLNPSDKADYKKAISEISYNLGIEYDGE